LSAGERRLGFKDRIVDIRIDFIFLYESIRYLLTTGVIGKFEIIPYMLYLSHGKQSA